MLLAEQQMRIAARNGKTLVLVFVDLNGMKRINDALGHKMGDRALVDTASILRRVFRRSDVIARLGGDEFVVLATDCVDAADPSYTTRLKDALVEHNASPESPFRLSLSAGTSIFDPSQPTSLEALISDADARMYEAKHSRQMSTFPRVNLA
jgi:diguanylate cyclase (GGDEF)-like protein